MLTYEKACEIRERMHDTYDGSCAKCPMSSDNNGTRDGCALFFVRYPEKVEYILTDWDEKHPVRTILDEFKENYPDAPMNEHGVPDKFCPTDIGYKTDCYAYPGSPEGCVKCWSHPAKTNK